MKQVNRILAVIFAASLLIALRSFHLGVVQRDARLIDAQKPQSRTILQRADRGTICDRFGIPLAVNRICYNAVIYYSQITQIPQTKYVIVDGKRIKTFPRKEYIQNLSQLLSDLLDLSAERIEDLIYSKASLFPHAPFRIKTNLTESEHYRLKSLERDLPGIHAEIGSYRFYPKGKAACHILGTMGAISQKKYQEIAGELSSLQEALDSYILPNGYSSMDALEARLSELKEKAYSLTDSVGKSGIEAQFEEELRGFYGKKYFNIDHKGSFCREMAGGRDATPGSQIVLSISAELQEFAEELLAKAEIDRDGRSFGIDPTDGTRKSLKQPWIKGGAIVAMDPTSGEVLALASFPRFDPNDFIRKEQLNICKWLENESYIGAIWDGKSSLDRQRKKETPQLLSWDFYLDLILPKESPQRAFFQTHDTVKSAIQLQEDYETIRYFSSGHPKAALASRRFNAALSEIGSENEKLFLVDLCRVCIDSTRFSDELVAKIGSMKLSHYRELSTCFFDLEEKVKKEEALRFEAQDFAEWRKIHQKSFLQEKRKEEKEKGTYARPYLDYLDQKKKELFDAHWQNQKKALLLSRIQESPKLLHALENFEDPLKLAFLHTFRSFKELDRPLLHQSKKFTTEKDLAASFYPKGGFGYLRSYAFQANQPQGSLFKLVTAYEGLRQGHNPVIVDDAGKDRKIVAYTPTGTPYPRMYKGGRLPRSSILQIGKIDVVGALMQTSNPYFSIMAGDYLADPDDLKMAAFNFGYGAKTGIELPAEAMGKLPNDLKTNKTSLYSFAFGQHTLLCTPLQTCRMLSAMADQGKVRAPKIAMGVKGLAPDRKALSAFELKNSFCEKELKSLGIPFSLFTSVQTKEPIAEADLTQGRLVRSLPFPARIRSKLFEGMDKVMWSPKGTARPEIIRSLRWNPEKMAEHLPFQHQIIGKTSSAEILYQANANPTSLAQMVKYTWFGALSFLPDFPAVERYDHPELAVVVFLRFSDAGKEAAPLAVQMVKKWREIKKKYK